MTQKQYVIRALEEMDLSMLEIILDDGITYHNVSKQRFIYALDKLFRTVRFKWGNVQFRAVPGKCEKASVHASAYRFITVKNQHAYDLVIEVRNEKVTDIYSCISLSCNIPIKERVGALIFNDDELDFEVGSAHLKVLRINRKGGERLRKEQEENVILSPEFVAQWIKDFKTPVEPGAPFRNRPFPPSEKKLFDRLWVADYLMSQNEHADFVLSKGLNIQKSWTLQEKFSWFAAFANDFRNSPYKFYCFDFEQYQRSSCGNYYLDKDLVFRAEHMATSIRLLNFMLEVHNELVAEDAMTKFKMSHTVLNPKLARLKSSSAT